MSSGDATKIKFKLSDGNYIPALGLGTANFGERVPPTKGAVITAINAGYRHIDTAWSYETEEVIGEALKELFDSGVVKREDLFITTKVGTKLAKDPARSLNESLERLGLDYVDLLLQHWPLSQPLTVDDEGSIVRRTDSGEDSKVEYDFVDYYQRLEELYLNNKDKIKSIGVSNYSVPFLRELLLKAKVKPVVNQVELHPHLPQIELVKFAEENGIVITAYSPVGAQGAPNLKIPIVQELAQKYNSTPNAILSTYHIKEGRVVIPKSINAERIKASTELVDLQDDDLERLTEFGLKNPKRFIHPDFGRVLGFDLWHTS